MLVARVNKDDSAKKNSSGKLKIKKDILGTLGNWRVWPHILMAICLIAPTGAMGTYTPTLIKSFKFESERRHMIRFSENGKQLNRRTS